MWSLAPLYIVVFVGFLGYSLMITVFTPMILLNDNGMLPASSSAATRNIVLGLLLCLYPLGQFLGAPVLGALSDRMGRRPVLLGSLAVSTVW
jgi:MFS family permease